MSDICALVLFPFSYSGQGCPQPVGENVKELAKLKHFVKGRHICKVNPSALSGCSLPAAHKTAIKKTSFSLFPVERRSRQLPAFPVPPAWGAGCVHRGWRGIKEATISEGKAGTGASTASPALLVLPFPCSFCPGRVSLCPTHQTSSAFLQQQKPVGRVVRVCRPSWREPLELPTREELSLLPCSSAAPSTVSSAWLRPAWSPT